MGFLWVGGLNTALTYAFYLLLSVYLSYQVAYAATYVVGICLSYWLNLRFVFRRTSNWARILRYPLIYVVQYAIGAGLLELAVAWAGVPSEIAPLIVIVALLPLSFLLNEYVLSSAEEKS